MTEHCILTVHTFNPVRPVDPNPALVAQRTKAARRLVRSLWDPPTTSYSSPACKLDPPYEPLAGTKSYSTAPPPAASPHALRSAHPRSAPAPTSPRQLPSFTHWTGSHSPSPPLPPPPRPNKPRASSPQPDPTQGILKKHPRVAGAWSDAPSAAPGGGAGRERKRVRVESPRSSEAKAAARRATLGGSGAGVKADAGAAVGRGPSAGSSRARELVPPTPPSRPVFAEPAQQQEKAEDRREEVEPERPDLARGAIQRCIPYPYTPPARPPRPGEAPNPARQHPARVLHSFVDPLWTPAPVVASLSRTTSTSASISQTQSQTQRHAHTSSSLPLDSPATLSALAPGRRGAWLLPLSGALPSFAVSCPSSPTSSASAAAASAAARTSPAVPAYFARPPRRRRSSSAAATSSTSTSSKDAHGHRRLEWTDARVRAVWDCVAQLGAAGGGWGVVRCDAWWPPDEAVVDGKGEAHGREEGAAAGGEGAEAAAGEGGDGPCAWPAMLRIACPAHLALALRGLLAQVSVSALARAGRRRAGATRSEEEGRAGEKGQEVEVEREEAVTDEEDDDDRFLRGRRLLWVDEEGKPVLIA